MDPVKFQAILEIIQSVISVGSNIADIMKKNNITVEDVQALAGLIKENPEDYFPKLKKAEDAQA